jgi:hypothetical protein
VDERSRRIGQNEAVFREVNERIERLTRESQSADEPLAILCECGDEGCRERIELTVSEYERLRSDPTHFAVVPGHAEGDVETVVERLEGYNVVAKDGVPARIAEDRDPRS